MPQPSPTLRAELAVHTPGLRRLAQRLVGGDGDDLVQDTLVIALTRSPSDAGLGGWLRHVLRNEHRGRVRRERRRRAREQHVADGDGTFAVDPAHTQIAGALWRVVDELDEPYRAAIVARFLEDRSAAEIARAEGCPAATVRWRVQEGLRRTRRTMDERFEGRSQWLGALVAFAELPAAMPVPIHPSPGARPMTKLALLKVLTGVAAVAATTTFVVTQTPVVDAHPAASAAPLVIAAPPVVDASIATREHPSSLVASLTADVSNAALLAAGASPDGAPPSDPAGGCEECQGECADADDLPLAPEVAALLAVDTPIGDPMDAIARFDLPRQGRADAKVSIVACSEFDCPFCKRATATLDEIRESYGDAVAVYWLNSPLPAHPGAVPAAAAGIAAAAQGKFWEIHDLLFARPEARSEDELVALAKELGLDVQRFRDDVRAPATLATIEEQQRTCFGNGAQGTPSFFVNGDLVVGAQPFESFAAIIDDELAQ